MTIVLFTSSFLRFVPVMIALTGLEIIRSATLMAQSRHSSLTDWWHFFNQVAQMMLDGFLLGSFPLITLEGFRSLPFSAGWDITRIESGVNSSLKVILILSLVGMGVDVIRRLYREIRNPAG